jgi:hypothetical protein
VSRYDQESALPVLDVTSSESKGANVTSAETGTDMASAEHHHRIRFFGFNGDYGCWWSRRYHRWVCPYY